MFHVLCSLLLFSVSSLWPVCVSVSDGEHTTPELDFAILLLSNHQQPPVFQVLDPLLEVSMGGQAAIGQRRTHAHTKIHDTNTHFQEMRACGEEGPVSDEVVCER